MNNSKGFTLIEIMIVVVIIGVLASIAMPSYQEYTRKGYRTEGQAFLNDAAARQERFFSQNRSYVTNTQLTKLGLPANGLSATDRYKIKLAVGTSADGGYVLTAEPTFSDPKCGNLVLNAVGVRTVSSGDKNYCWR